MKNPKGAGAKKRFNEDGVYLQILVPKSKKDTLKKIFLKLVEPYKK